MTCMEFVCIVGLPLLVDITTAIVKHKMANGSNVTIVMFAPLVRKKLYRKKRICYFIRKEYRSKLILKKQRSRVHQLVKQLEFRKLRKKKRKMKKLVRKNERKKRRRRTKS